MELRWLDRSYIRCDEHGQSHITIKPVLQYRTFERPQPGLVGNGQWSEWIDVPTVYDDQ